MLLWLTVALAGPPAVEPLASADAVRGEQIAGLGACVACHTTAGSPELAGGYAVRTAYGVFYGRNLTPDPTGLGGWSYADFVTAMRLGRGADGHALWPAFPYASFSGLSDRDLSDLWAWLGTIAPVVQDDRPHEIKGAYRGGLGLWRMMAFRPATTFDDGLTDDGAAIRDEATRGRYLVDALGHCGECHTPRSSVGVPKRHRYLQGWDDLHAPDISALGWNTSELASFLDDGMTPDGDVTGGEMFRVIREGTSRLNDADRRAIAAWITALAD